MLQQDIEGGHYNTDDVDTEDCDFDEDEACLLLDYTLTAIVNGSYQLSLKKKKKKKCIVSLHQKKVTAFLLFSLGREIEVLAVKRDCVKVYDWSKKNSCDWSPYNFISLDDFQASTSVNITRRI